MPQTQVCHVGPGDVWALPIWHFALLHGAPWVGTHLVTATAKGPRGMPQTQVCHVGPR